MDRLGSFKAKNNERLPRVRGLRKSRRSVGVAKPMQRGKRDLVARVAIFAVQVNAFGWIIVFKRIKALYR